MQIGSNFSGFQIGAFSSRSFQRRLEQQRGNPAESPLLRALRNNAAPSPKLARPQENDLVRKSLDRSPEEGSKNDRIRSAKSTEVAAQYKESTSQNISIITAEGDRVTISSARSVQASYSSYSRSVAGVVGGKDTTLSESGTEFSSSSSKSFNISVEGELNEQEQKDIATAIESFGNLEEKLKQGDISGAVESSIKLADLDSLTRIVGETTVEKSIGIAARVTEFMDDSPIAPLDEDYRPNKKRGEGLLEDSSGLRYAYDPVVDPDLMTRLLRGRQ